MKVLARKFTERNMSYFALKLPDGRETYCRSFSGEFDKRTQSAARAIIDVTCKVNPRTVQFDLA